MPRVALEVAEVAAVAFERGCVLRSLARMAPVAAIRSEVQVGAPEMTSRVLPQGVRIPSHAQE